MYGGARVRGQGEAGWRMFEPSLNKEPEAYCSHGCESKLKSMAAWLLCMGGSTWVVFASFIVCLLLTK